jgi:hypothetical protein
MAYTNSVMFSEENELGVACSTHGEVEECILGFGGKVRRRERPRHRWVNNIKMDLRDIGWDVMDWIDLAEDRNQWRAFVNTVMNLRVP